MYECMYVCSSHCSRLLGLIDKKEIDSAYAHVQKFLLERDLIDPVTKEILEVSDKKKAATRPGFIVSLDGQTFIEDNERKSNGETVNVCEHDVR